MRGAWLAVWVLVLIVGCSQKPGRVSTPSWDPEGFADAVLEKLDKNGDASLDKTELAASPGLTAGAKPIDTDKNGALSRDELVARFALYKKMRIGITSSQIQVVYKGQPLDGAKVTLVPEFFLEGLVEPAVGETMSGGFVDARVDGLQPSGMRVGYYRAVVESKAKIPAKYTKAETTTAGIEVSPVQDAVSGNPQIVLRD